MLARMHVFVSISTSFQTDYSDSLDFACVKCQCPHPWVCIAWVLPAVTIPKCDEWVAQKNYSSGQRRSNGQLWEPVLYLHVSVGLERSGFKIQVYEDAMLLLKTLNTFYHHNIDQLIFSFLWPECLTKTMEGKKDSAWLTVWGETTDLAGQAPGRSMRQVVMLPLQSGSTDGHPGAPPSFSFLLSLEPATGVAHFSLVTLFWKQSQRDMYGSVSMVIVNPLKRRLTIIASLNFFFFWNTSSEGKLMQSSKRAMWNPRSPPDHASSILSGKEKIFFCPLVCLRHFCFQSLAS